MFGISPDKLALSPSSVLQNIIQEKQLAARERERATSERLALKRIAQTEAAQAQQARQFEVSQASRGKMSDYQKWLKDNWGKMTPQQQAAEARKQEIYEREKAGEQAIDKWGQPTGQPTTQPVVQPAQDTTTVTPEAGFKGLPDYLKKQPAQVKAPSKTYTPKASIAPAFETNPDLQVGFQELYDATKKPTIIQEAKMKQRAKDEIISENPNVKSLRTLQRKAKVRAAKYQREAETNRKNAVTTLFNTEQDLKAKLKPAKLTYAQKTKIKAIKIELNQGSYLTKGLTGRPVKNEIKSLNDAMGYIAFRKESPDKFTKELEKYGLKDNETLIKNNMRVYGKSRTEVIKAMKAQGLL